MHSALFPERVVIVDIYRATPLLELSATVSTKMTVIIQ